MMTVNRTFKVLELGKSASITDIRMPMTDTVEVVDITTNSVLKVKAAAVSMYRHMLRWQGKNYNILNIQ